MRTACRSWSAAHSLNELALQFEWWRGYYPFAQPHASLRQVISGARSPRGQPRDRQRTPARVAGLTTRRWTVPMLITKMKQAARPMNKAIIETGLGEGTISKYIYGHFAEHLGGCIYDGFWVGPQSSIPNTRGIRNDIVEALRRISIPILRWPGGCFADEYHWQDGIGPYENRASMLNTHWGRVSENNHFGTHEFMDLCEQLGCEPYICGNVGSGTVQEMQQWVEYLTLDGKSPMADRRRANGRDKPWPVRYWGVGNESWGCGGKRQNGSRL